MKPKDLPITEILAQLAEEAAELSQAALKCRRALDGTNPTPKSVSECLDNLNEELADVTLCTELIDELRNDNAIRSRARIIAEKGKRWEERLSPKMKSAHCPFCGNTDTVEVTTLGTIGDYFTYPDYFTAFCNAQEGGCGAIFGGQYPTEEEALAAWNRRVNNE